MEVRRTTAIRQIAHCDAPKPPLPKLLEKRVVSITLPQWIDHLIFEDLGANYSPSGSMRAFDRNLHSTTTEIKTYLGTYFPRSFAEAFVIFNSLFSDEGFLNLLKQQEDVSVCSVGTGTGGDLLGFLLALEDHVDSLPKINITSIEGNQESHLIAKKIIEEASGRTSFDVDAQFVNHELNGPRPFENLAFLPDKPALFDFVITTKMLNEIDGEGVSKNPYYEFCEAFTKRIKASGIIAILDISSSNGANGEWTPIRMNSQITSFVRKHGEYETLLPLLCGSFEKEKDNCAKECYTQSRLRISHSRKDEELCKSCYRVIGRQELVNNLRFSTALWECPLAESNKNYCKALSLIPAIHEEEPKDE